MIPTITANVAAWLIVNRDAFTNEEQEQLKSDLRAGIALLQEERAQVQAIEATRVEDQAPGYLVRNQT